MSRKGFSVQRKGGVAVSCGNDFDVTRPGNAGEIFTSNGPLAAPSFRAGTAVVLLTAVQVKALFTTPRTLVAAQGAGTIVIIDDIQFTLPFVSTAYAGANNLEFRYTNGAGAKVTADIANTVLNATGATNYNSVKGVTTALVGVANAAVVVCVPVANPTLGDSEPQFTIRYHVVTP